MNDRDTFKKHMTMFAGTFNTELTELMLKTYWEILSDMSDGEFEASARAYMTVGRFFPKPADLIEHSAGSPVAKKERVWTSVVRGLRDSSNMKVSNSAMEAVKAIGGARYLGQLSMKELEFKKKDFMEVYQEEEVVLVGGIDSRLLD